MEAEQIRLANYKIATRSSGEVGREDEGASSIGKKKGGLEKGKKKLGLFSHQEMNLSFGRLYLPQQRFRHG